jgi:zinc transport system substrate-binding protein
MFRAASVYGAEGFGVFVSIVPQKTFVERIGGKFVKVSVMVKPGSNPATYEPKPRQMVALSEAKIYYAIGVPFEEAWLTRIASANPKILIIPTEKGIRKMPMKVHRHYGQRGSVAHKREENQEDEGHHGILDPHVWLSPPLVQILAKNILDGLVAVDPTHRTHYQANYKAFIDELDTLDAQIRAVFSEKGENVEFMVFHPAWGYFAQAYGLRQISVEMEGKEPKPAELTGLIRYARERGTKVIFVQPQFSTRSAEIIARGIDGRVVFANPLALDWATNLKEVARGFRAALR